jgi:hypothetical protein
MTRAFRVVVTQHFERLFWKLNKRHRDLLDTYQKAISIPQTDPHNRSHNHPIKKLQGAKPGVGSTCYESGVGDFATT